ncbi:NmrA family NAD(P)-binding protein [Streptomyces boninensis]|uniref:NmrA family NAD(P)-binding protein n=1 Tax=Streptomyces boninensis TaxID=2039455 RepID=UPI003B2139DD
MYLVTGATGNVGREVVRALLDRGAPVRALTRGGDAAGLPKGAEAVAGDLNDPASLAPALSGVRGAFFLPGYADMPGLLAEAKRAGVERVAQLSGRSAASGDMTNAVTAYMVRTEEAVRAAGLPWTVIRPSAFHANALRWLPQLRAGDTVRLPFAGVRLAGIDPYDIGEVAAVALLEDGHDGKVYELSGPESLLPADQVRILGEALGRELRFEAQPDDEARAEMSAAMPQEYVDAFFRFYVDGDLDESPVLATVREVTGRDPRTFARWARAHAEDFA